jgi:hypothetical protein
LDFSFDGAGGRMSDFRIKTCDPALLAVSRWCVALFLDGALRPVDEGGPLPGTL